MTIASEVVDDVQLGESLALEFLTLIVKLIGPAKTQTLLTQAAVAQADAIANAAEDAKFGPAKS